MDWKSGRIDGPVSETLLAISKIQVCSWCPDDVAQAPPEQVHILLGVQGLEEYSFAVRFKNRKALQGFIDALLVHRDDVWPEGGEAISSLGDN